MAASDAGADAVHKRLGLTLAHSHSGRNSGGSRANEGVFSRTTFAQHSPSRTPSCDVRSPPEEAGAVPVWCECGCPILRSKPQGFRGCASVRVWPATFYIFRWGGRDILRPPLRGGRRPRRRVFPVPLCHRAERRRALRHWATWDTVNLSFGATPRSLFPKAFTFGKKSRFSPCSSHHRRKSAYSTLTPMTFSNVVTSRRSAAHPRTGSASFTQPCNSSREEPGIVKAPRLIRRRAPSTAKSNRRSDSSRRIFDTSKGSHSLSSS